MSLGYAHLLVDRTLSGCEGGGASVRCSKTNVTFNAMQPVRMSLPIKGLMYRWQCDLFGPYPESGDWNYVYINNYYNNIYFNIYILQLLYCITI